MTISVIKLELKGDWQVPEQECELDLTTKLRLSTAESIMEYSIGMTNYLVPLPTGFTFVQSNIKTPKYFQVTTL